MTDESSITTPVSAGARPRTRVRDMVAAALVCAVMVVLGPVASVGAVPVTLQIFPVALAALLLPAEWAAGSMALYLMIGAAGVPVFAHGTAGLGTLFGPTGGFIFGFVAGAGLGALVRRLVASKHPGMAADIAGAAIAVIGVYALGWAWLAFGPTHLPPMAALLGGVAPFVIPASLNT